MAHRLDSILRYQSAAIRQPRRYPSRELADEPQVNISLIAVRQQGKCPSCNSTAFDITGCPSCGIEWAVLDANDEEYRTFQGEDEANAKKQRVEASKDGHEATGRVGGTLYKVSAMVDREAQRQGEGAGVAWQDGLRVALELIEELRDQPLELSRVTRQILGKKLDDVAKGLRRHQEDPRCAAHDPNCAFKAGRRFSHLCVGMAVAREALEQARRVPDALLVKALSLRLRADGVLSGDRSYDAGKARSKLRLATRMAEEARSSLKQGRAASHYAPREAPPPLVRRVSPRLTEAAEEGEPAAGAPGCGASGSSSAAAPPVVGAAGAGEAGGAARGAAVLPAAAARQPSAPVKELRPYGPEKELPHDVARLLGHNAVPAVAQAMRLHASGVVRRIYASDWKGKSQSVRAVALFLAHAHLHKHRPDLEALGLPSLLDDGAYGVAVGLPTEGAAERVRKFVAKAAEKGVRDGAVEGSF